MVLNKNKSKKVIEESSTESESEQDSCQDYSEEEDDQYSESEEECSSSEQEESSSESEEDEKPKKKITKKVIKKAIKKKHESDSEEESEDEPEIMKKVVEKTKKTKKEEEISKSIMEEVLFMIPFKSFNENIRDNTIDAILLGALDDELFNYFGSNKMKNSKIMPTIQEARKKIKKMKMGEFSSKINDSVSNITELADLNIDYKYSDNDIDNKYFKYFNSMSLCFGKCKENKIAELVHLRMKNNFFCESDGKKGHNVYYCSEYTNYWLLDDGGAKIRNTITKITTDIISKVYKFYRSIMKNDKIISAVNKNKSLNETLIGSSKGVREITKKFIDTSLEYGEAMSSKYGNENKFTEEKNSENIKLSEPIKIKSIYQFHPTISNYFDKINPNVTAFKDIIYDFKTNEARKAEPNELISMHLDYNYEEISDSMKSRMEYIYKKLLLAILNTDEEVNYVLSLFARFLVNDCPGSDNFYIFKGTGGNGKSLLIRLLTETLSVYSGSLKSQYFDSRKSGITGTGADSTLAKMVNKRIGVVPEIPDEKDFKISLDTLKSITGRDNMDYRELFGKSKEAVFNFIPIFLTNRLIDFSDSHDNQGTTNSAIPRRLRATTFFNTFKDEVDPNDKYAKLGNSSIKNTISKPEYKIAFFHILKEAFYKLQDNKFVIQETPISAVTKKHFLSSFDDGFDEFINNITIRDETPLKLKSYHKIKVTDLYDKYKLYCYYNEKILNAKNFKAKMTDSLRYEIVMISTYYYKHIKYVENYDKIITTRVEQLKQEQDKDKTLEKAIKKITGEDKSRNVGNFMDGDDIED
jgi:hypothetical protein